MGDRKQAEASFKRIISDQFQADTNIMAGAFFHLGEISFLNNRHDAAQQYFQKAVETDRNHLKASEYLTKYGA